MKGSSVWSWPWQPRTATPRACWLDSKSAPTVRTPFRPADELKAVHRDIVCSLQIEAGRTRRRAAPHRNTCRSVRIALRIEHDWIVVGAAVLLAELEAAFIGPAQEIDHRARFGRLYRRLRRHRTFARCAASAALRADEKDLRRLPGGIRVVAIEAFRKTHVAAAACRSGRALTRRRGVAGSGRRRCCRLRCRRYAGRQGWRWRGWGASGRSSLRRWRRRPDGRRRCGRRDPFRRRGLLAARLERDLDAAIGKFGLHFGPRDGHLGGVASFFTGGRESRPLALPRKTELAKV